MKAFIILALVAAATASHILSDEEVRKHFVEFKNKYNRFYQHDVEFYKYRIFHDNIQLIFSHNKKADAGEKTYRLAVNNFTDFTNEEFRAYFNGYRGPRIAHFNEERDVYEPKNGQALPATVDWRKKGIVTGVKNQEQCGSCWAFSAVASMEGQHALKTKKLVSLSEQNLVDCSGPEGNMGCGGGLMDQAFQYVIKNKGIDTEKSYPYKGIDESCEFKKKNVGATIKSFKDIPQGDENALQSAVANVGPISVAIDASQMSFQFYSSGVYNEPDCSSTELDHGVTAVGYGTQNGETYWLVKNSWGADWGEKGYILMSRNKDNQCGIATAASYPVV